MPAEQYNIRGKLMYRYEIDILGAVSRLHGAITGSSGDPPDEDVINLVAQLTARLHDWQPPIDRTQRYDETVRQLILAVLAEYRAPGHPYYKKPA